MTFSEVQHVAGAASAGGTSLALTLPGAPSDGNLLVAAVAWPSGGSSPKHWRSR